MRISRADLVRRWIWCSALAAAVFLLLSVLDASLKARSGLGIGDLPGFGSAHLLRQAFEHWWRPLFALSAGFELGLGYLFLPLYGASFYLSGVMAREAFAPRPGLLRRAMDMLALAPLLGAGCDAVARALYFWMLIQGTNDSLAALAGEAGMASEIAFLAGLALFIAAFVSVLGKRKPATAK